MKKIVALLFLFGCLGAKLSFAQQMAYIANNDLDNVSRTIAICPIAEDGGLGKCALHFDRTFAAPVDVILNDDASVAYVANAQDHSVSICPVNSDGTLALCVPFNDPSLELAGAGLRLSADNTLLYITNILNEGTFSVCPVLDKGYLGSCTLYGHSHFKGSLGRIAFDLAGESIYVPNARVHTVSICDTVFKNCSSIIDLGLSVPAGIDFNASGDYFFVANADKNNVVICATDKNTECAISRGYNSIGYPTFDFAGGVTNIFTRTTTGYGYVPNRGNNTISVCPIDPTTGALDLCTAYNGGGSALNNPSSIWLADL